MRIPVLLYIIQLFLCSLPLCDLIPLRDDVIDEHGRDYSRHRREIQDLNDQGPRGDSTIDGAGDSSIQPDEAPHHVQSGPDSDPLSSGQGGHLEGTNQGSHLPEDNGGHRDGSSAGHSGQSMHLDSDTSPDIVPDGVVGQGFQDNSGDHAGDGGIDQTDQEPLYTDHDQDAGQLLHGDSHSPENPDIDHVQTEHGEAGGLTGDGHQTGHQVDAAESGHSSSTDIEEHAAVSENHPTLTRNGDGMEGGGSHTTNNGEEQSGSSSGSGHALSSRQEPNNGRPIIDKDGGSHVPNNPNPSRLDEGETGEQQMPIHRGSTTNTPTTPPTPVNEHEETFSYSNRSTIKVVIIPTPALEGEHDGDSGASEHSSVSQQVPHVISAGEGHIIEGPGDGESGQDQFSGSGDDKEDKDDTDKGTDDKLDSSDLFSLLPGDILFPEGSSYLIPHTTSYINPSFSTHLTTVGATIGSSSTTTTLQIPQSYFPEGHTSTIISTPIKPSETSHQLGNHATSQHITEALTSSDAPESSLVRFSIVPSASHTIMPTSVYSSQSSTRSHSIFPTSHAEISTIFSETRSHEQSEMKLLINSLIMPSSLASYHSGRTSNLPHEESGVEVQPTPQIGTTSEKEKSPFMPDTVTWYPDPWTNWYYYPSSSLNMFSSDFLYEGEITTNAFDQFSSTVTSASESVPTSRTVQTQATSQTPTESSTNPFTIPTETMPSTERRPASTRRQSVSSSSTTPRNNSSSSSTTNWPTTPKTTLINLITTTITTKTKDPSISGVTAPNTTAAGPSTTKHKPVTTTTKPPEKPSNRTSGASSIVTTLLSRSTTPSADRNRSTLIPSPVPTVPPLYIQIQLLMNWGDFCSRQDPFKVEIKQIIYNHGRVVLTDQIRIINLPSEECGMSNILMDTGRTMTQIVVEMYLVDDNGKINMELTIDCSKVIEGGFKSGTSYFKDKVIGAKLVDHHGNSGNRNDVASNLPKEKRTGSSITMVIVIASVGGCCCIVLIILQVMINRRNNRKMRPYISGQRLSINSTDTVALGVIPKSRPASGYWNPAVEEHEEVSEPSEHSHLVNFAGLANFSMDQDAIYDEFKLIPSETPGLSCVPVGAEDKNRYANVLPFKHTRVRLKKLPGEENSDYINANYVTGYRDDKGAYIATQAPLESTQEDFWRMVWEQQSRVILMTVPMEASGDPRQCPVYWPDEVGMDSLRKYGDIVVALKKKDVQQEYIESVLEIKDIETNLIREVRHFWYTSWPQNGTPEPLSVVKFVLDTRPHYENSGAPVILHCCSGTGRTGVIIAVDLCMRMFEDKRRVDILSCVHKMRSERAGVVHTKEQYALIYKALNEYAVILSSPSISTRSSIVTLHAML